MATRLDWQTKRSNAQASHYMDELRAAGYTTTDAGPTSMTLAHPDGRECQCEQVSPRRVLLTHFSPVD